MITELKIRTYKFFNGDIDGWARSGTEEQKTSMNDQDWALIEDLLQEIRLVRRDLTTKVRAEELEGRLNSLCDNQNTIHALKEMAGV